MTSDISHGGILVPIDIYGVSRTTLEVLVRVAERLQASLFGLILEDPRLQKAATLPFAREIVMATGLEREFYMDSLMRLQQSLSRDVRRLFDELAAPGKIELKLETSSAGRSLKSLMREGMDLYLPTRRRWPRSSAMLPGARPRCLRRLGLFYDRSPQARRALEIGLALVRDGLVREVGLIASGPVPLTDVATFADVGVRTFVHRLAVDCQQEVADLFRRSAFDLVLVPRNLLLPLATDTLEAALEETASEILILA